ncbi:hypothetical protein BMS3Abin17_01299 [archaeon BMS3Abin17]|nr:hypothetical protein BMS3Abin17_01299 [archaeon BMS3Abin17]HDZ60690.1 ArsR family transcriptional regulator [Candidatus Pacearchaeota archaeon]
MLTKNEKKVLKLLLLKFDNEYSVNELARKCSLSPNGALKILRKFEEEGILISKKIANIKSYGLNFNNEKTKNILELSLINELEGKLKFRKADLEPLKEIAICCIVFGSYTDIKKEPNDMDILFIIDKSMFKEYRKKALEIFKSIPVKVHDIIQTKEDFKENICKKDKVIINALRYGVIFWGHNEIIEFIENEYKR